MLVDRCAHQEEERGFALVEMLVSVSIMLLVSLSVLLLIQSVTRVFVARLSGQDDTIALARQIDRMQADASTADAIFSPNADEVDFFSLTNTADGADVFDPNVPRVGLYWKYLYDPVARTVRRYDYVPGLRVTQMRSVQATPGYVPLQGVSHFFVRVISADKLIGGIDVRAFPVNVSGPGVTGGNQVTEVTISTQAGARVVHLLPGTFPSGFTVVDAAVYKAIVYRVDLTHRACLGLCGKTHVLIKGEVYVSYDRWRSKAPWCDYQIYRDTNETYVASDLHEMPDHMRQVCGSILKVPLPVPHADGGLSAGLKPFEAPDTWYDGSVGNESR
jgi:type II secretory pathway pseudopilin PulG